MKSTCKWIAAALAAGLLASCASAPTRVAQAPPAPVAKEAPYRWTQGHAPTAYKQAVALFGPLNMRPGDYRWVADVPKEGETTVVVDLLTQLFYVYRGEKLVGVSTISSGKKGKETPLGLWAVRLEEGEGLQPQI